MKFIYLVGLLAGNLGLLTGNAVAGPGCDLTLDPRGIAGRPSAYVPDPLDAALTAGMVSAWESPDQGMMVCLRNVPVYLYDRVVFTNAAGEEAVYSPVEAQGDGTLTACYHGFSGNRVRLVKRDVFGKIKRNLSICVVR